MRSELDAWLRGCPITEHASNRGGDKSHQLIASLRPAMSELHELRADMRRNREEMHQSLGRLMSTLHKIQIANTRPRKFITST
jgi:hypothetical protein